MHLYSVFYVLVNVLHICLNHCIQSPPRIFHLIKRCQRSQQNIAELDNVASLDECFELAENAKALALNYSPLRGMQSNLLIPNHGFDRDFPIRTNRRHFLSQPEEFFNCHALQCPESSAFSTMINDSRYDYYSLYGNPPGKNKFVCVPEIGIFQLNLSPEKYEIAFKSCNKSTNGTLAHVASEKRTNALAKLLQGPDFINGTPKLAYIGLNYSITQKPVFKNSENEDLSCFLYRAWAPGHPTRNGAFFNSSCVALTTAVTWMTVDCERSLPYICEVFTSRLNESNYLNACDMFLKNLQ